MPKTVRKRIVHTVDGKVYFKCAYPDCDYLIENPWYDPKTGMIQKHLSVEDGIDKYVREVHQLVWLRKGKTAGWWSLAKIQAGREAYERYLKESKQK